MRQTRLDTYLELRRRLKILIMQTPMPRENVKLYRLAEEWGVPEHVLKDIARSLIWGDKDLKGGYMLRYTPRGYVVTRHYAPDERFLTAEELEARAELYRQVEEAMVQRLAEAIRRAGVA